MYVDRTPAGQKLACKVFGSHGVTKLVQWVLLGSPNPYVWNEDAVRCAVLRRTILTDLVPLWFGPRLRVTNAVAHEWNEAARAFELRTEFSPGRPPALHHPLRRHDGDEARTLVRNLLRPLQRHLIDAGFDGLVWQAGKGNPVALNNFLFEPETDGGRWSWIDLESGVPALPAINPIDLFGFYLPRTVAFRRPLFDDVNAGKVQAYVAARAKPLRDRLGADRYETLLGEVEELGTLQARWKGLRRVERSIEYRKMRGDLTDEQAAWYRRHPLRWYARELQRSGPAAVRLIGKAMRRLGKLWRRLELKTLLVAIGKFLASQSYRASIARGHVSRSIDAWRDRGQMSTTDADELRAHLDSEESTSYMTDFGIHLALKPFVKSIEYWVFPLLFATGWISGTTLAVAILAGGALGRTLYTAGRLLQSVVHNREKPWIALFVGVLPIVGNFAYPLQLLYSSTREQDSLARFILYDHFGRLGRKLPVWGGPDTQTEHIFNRLPDRLPILRRRVRESP